MKLYMIPQNTYLTLKYGVYFRRYYRQRKKISIWLCIELWMWAYIPGTCCNQKFSLFTKRIYIYYLVRYIFLFRAIFTQSKSSYKRGTYTRQMNIYYGGVSNICENKWACCFLLIISHVFTCTMLYLTVWWICTTDWVINKFAQHKKKRAYGFWCYSCFFAYILPLYLPCNNITFSWWFVKNNDTQAHATGM